MQKAPDSLLNFQNRSLRHAIHWSVFREGTFTSSTHEKCWCLCLNIPTGMDWDKQMLLDRYKKLWTHSQDEVHITNQEEGMPNYTPWFRVQYSLLRTHPSQGPADQFHQRISCWPQMSSQSWLVSYGREKEARLSTCRQVISSFADTYHKVYRDFCPSPFWVLSFPSPHLFIRLLFSCRRTGSVMASKDSPDPW